MNKQALFVFTKYPEKGKVKTRLAKDIGNENAYAVYIRLVNTILKEVSHLKQTDVFIYFDKYQGHYPKEFIDIKTQYKEQSGKTIGDKMHNAFVEGKKLGYEKMVLIGCDIYQLTQKDIQQAFSYLEKSDIVFGKANDGGYYLTGMKKVYKPVFSLSQWSHNKVIEETLAIVNALGLKVAFTPTKIDVDTLDDLKQTSLYDAFG